MTTWRHRARIALFVARLVVYPPLVWLLTSRFPARSAALILAGFLGSSLILELIVAENRVASVVLPPLFVVALSLASFFTSDPRFLLAQPVLVSLVLLGAFGATLLKGPPMIERYARMMVPDLRAEEARYCRSVTWVWCVFFVANGATAAGLALAAPVWAWALWTGAGSYAAIGLLFVIELTVRKARFRRYGQGLHDKLFARIFPPTRTLDDLAGTNETPSPPCSTASRKGS